MRAGNQCGAVMSDAADDTWQLTFGRVAGLNARRLISSHPLPDGPVADAYEAMQAAILRLPAALVGCRGQGDHPLRDDDARAIADVVRRTVARGATECVVADQAGARPTPPTTWLSTSESRSYPTSRRIGSTSPSLRAGTAMLQSATGRPTVPAAERHCRRPTGPPRSRSGAPA